MNPATIASGAGPALGGVAPKPPQVTAIPSSLSAPKPVQMNSVPQTPVNGTTPANGSPAPELRIDTEPTDAGQGLAGGRGGAKDDNNAILGPADPSAPKKPDQETEVDMDAPDSPVLQHSTSETPTTTSAGARTEGVISTATDKDIGATAAGTSSAQAKDETRPGKTKITDKAADLVNSVKSKLQDKTDKDKAGSKGNISRNNKDKPRAVPAKTERKTRSQGPVEGA